MGSFKQISSFWIAAIHFNGPMESNDIYQVGKYSLHMIQLMPYPLEILTCDTFYAWIFFI